MRYALLTARLRAFPREDGGQTLPLVALMMTVLMAGTGLTIDVGNAIYNQRSLQTATNAAALAGAQSLPFSAIKNAAASTDPLITAKNYSAVTGSFNTRASLKNVAMLPGYPKLECLQSVKNQGIACVAPVVGADTGVDANVVQVAQTATVPLYFAGVLGFHNYTVTALATAAIRGGSPRPSNVAIILDTSLSMNAYDTDCGVNLTQGQCAMNGFQILLQNLQPCGSAQTNCGTATAGQVTNSFDRVALFTFPNVTSATASLDSTCTTAVPAPTSQNGYWTSTEAGATFNPVFNLTLPFSPTGTINIAPYSDIPTGLSYTYPTVGSSSYVPQTGTLPTSPATTATATYQITNFLSDYRTADTITTLNPNSALVQAAGGKSGCGGLSAPNYDGVYGTYYAGAIYAAQAALVNEQKTFPGSDNVIILLSDGDATSLQSWNGYASMGTPAGSSGVYPSYLGECGQGVTAAQYATAQGTLFYSVAYGSPPAGCTTDAVVSKYPGIAPCTAMQNMASAPQMFYSDWKQSGSNSVCIAGQPVTSLNAIFKSIAGDLTQPRLIPNNAS